MRKIMIFLILFLFEGCVYVGFGKGVRHIDPIPFDYDERTGEVTFSSSNSLKNEKIWVSFFQVSCGSYGLFGILVPIIPLWENFDCKNLKIRVSSADRVFVDYQGKLFNPIAFDPKYQTYTFPIPVKSLADGATLIIEKKNESSGKIEKFEIPFRYQHTFSFELWGT